MQLIAATVVVVHQTTSVQHRPHQISPSRLRTPAAQMSAVSHLEVVRLQSSRAMRRRGCGTALSVRAPIKLHRLKYRTANRTDSAVDVRQPPTRYGSLYCVVPSPSDVDNPAQGRRSPGGGGHHWLF